MLRSLSGFASLLTLVLVVAIAAWFMVFARYRLPATIITAGEIRPETGTYSAILVHGGTQREYLLHAPPAATAGRPLPVFILLHGGGATAGRALALSGLQEVADTQGFYIAMPQGFRGNWNDGRPDSGSEATKHNVDDVGFIVAMLDDIAKHLPVDSRRVYAAGISNGAMMTHRLACEATNRIAAVAMVAGTAPADLAGCSPSRPISVMGFHGTADPITLYAGGEVRSLFGLKKRGKVISAGDFKAFWVRFNRCSSERVAVRLPDINQDDHSDVLQESYSICDQGSSVIFYRVTGGGHTWPGGRQYASPIMVGGTNKDINASELIWAFFVQHPRP